MNHPLSILIVSTLVGMALAGCTMEEYECSPRVEHKLHLYSRFSLSNETTLEQRFGCEVDEYDWPVERYQFHASFPGLAEVVAKPVEGDFTRATSNMSAFTYAVGPQGDVEPSRGPHIATVPTWSLTFQDWNVDRPPNKKALILWTFDGPDEDAVPDPLPAGVYRMRVLLAAYPDEEHVDSYCMDCARASGQNPET